MIPLDQPFAFVSYARADQAAVLRIATSLRDRGGMLWLDHFELRAGEVWDRAIQLALESCVIVVVFLTPTAVDSQNVLDETLFAMDHRKLVLPVLLRTCNVPLRLHRLQRIDLTRNEEEGIRALTDAMPQGRHTMTLERATAEAPARKALGKVPYWKDAGAMLEYAKELAADLGEPSIFQRASEHYETFRSAVADYRDGGMTSQDDILEALTSLKDEVQAAWERLRAREDEGR
jgi:hypothetical protein